MTIEMTRTVTWPDIEQAPTSPTRAAVARLLLQRIAPRVGVSVMLPEGSICGPRHAEARMLIRDERFFHRLGTDLKIGLGESYMAGEWIPGAGTDLADLLTPFAAHLTDIVPAWMRRFRRLVEPWQPTHEENHREGARSNIARHYDLSNDLFAAFLDETMTYSSALFEGERTWATLASAQRRKIDAILDLAHVGEGTRLLEIGTGWGELALRAAARGAQVHTITLSREQQELAQQRIAAHGLTHRVHVELRDYRDLDGEYDAIASVEMIEAVGAKYWPTYFETVGRRLAPGGRFAMQAITMPHDRMLASQHAYTWIHKYIFPGGIIPSPEAIAQHAQADGGLRILSQRAFGQDYADTLRLWRQRFLDQQETLDRMGFDATFQRMWEFYLAYSEAGFRSGHLDVRHYAMERC